MNLGPYPLGPNDTPENGIYTGDATLLAETIPDNSIDLIFTDPVYQRIADYHWLAKIAARILKPDAVCLVWSNGKWHRTNTNWLEKAGLIYRWDFGCVIATGPAPMNGKIIAKTNRLIWLDITGNSRMLDYLADGYWSGSLPQLYREWHWTKNPKFIGQAIKAFTPHESIVFDPFTGGGTVPTVCKILGYQYLAFEIEPGIAQLARERVRQTQPPLPGLIAKQEKLGLKL